MKILLLDCDGVIITGKRFIEVRETELGINTKQADAFFMNIFQQCLIGKADLKKEIAPYLAEWGWKKSLNAFIEHWFSAESEVDSRLLQYVQELRQKGIHCYIATNQESYRTRYLKDVLRLDTAVDGMFTSCEIGFKKTSHEFFRSILHALPPDTQPTDIVFWDDSQRHVDVANAVGIHAELYTTFENFTQKMRRIFPIPS